VLLTCDADRDHRRSHVRGDAREARAQRVEPPLRVLLRLTVLVAIELERRGLDGRDRSRVVVVEEHLEALRAEIDAEYRLHRKWGGRAPFHLCHSKKGSDPNLFLTCDPPPSASRTRDRRS